MCLTLESALRADRDTRTPMRIALVVTAVKIALNALLIFGAPASACPRFGVAGAGFATLDRAGVAVALFVDRHAPQARERAARAARWRDFQGAPPYFRRWSASRCPASASAS